jgi:TRAP-type C4-dicarboxylate transport system permease small subunit
VQVFGSDRLEFLPVWLQIVLLVVSGALLAWLLIGRGWQTAERWLGALHDLVGNLAGVLIGLFALAIAGDLLLRELQWGNLPGMQEVMEYALFISVFIAAPWALRLGSHIRVDLLLTALPDTVSRRLEFALDLFGALLCAGLAYYSLLSVVDAYVGGSMQRKTYVVHDGFLRSFLVASFALLTAEFAFRVHRAREIDPHTDAKQGGF